MAPFMLMVGQSVCLSVYLSIRLLSSNIIIKFLVHAKQ